jgi:ferrous iron transport protein A
MQTTLCTLDSLSAGTRHEVSHVSLRGVLGDRLVELGFTPGAPVQLLRRAPFGGPLQVQVRDFVLSLRRADARLIYIAEPARGAQPLQVAQPGQVTQAAQGTHALPASRAA